MVKFCPLILKILSRNEILTSINGHNSVTNVQKIVLYKPTSMLSILICIQNLVQFCPFILKILSGNKILTSIKGRNFAANLRKMTFYYPNLDLINVNVHTKFG